MLRNRSTSAQDPALWVSFEHTPNQGRKSLFTARCLAKASILLATIASGLIVASGASAAGDSSYKVRFDSAVDIQSGAGGSGAMHFEYLASPVIATPPDSSGFASGSASAAYAKASGTMAGSDGTSSTVTGATGDIFDVIKFDPGDESTPPSIIINPHQPTEQYHAVDPTTGYSYDYNDMQWLNDFETFHPAQNGQITLPLKPGSGPVVAEGKFTNSLSGNGSIAETTTITVIASDCHAYCLEAANKKFNHDVKLACKTSPGDEAGPYQALGCLIGHQIAVTTEERDCEKQCPVQGARDSELRARAWPCTRAFRLARESTRWWVEAASATGVRDGPNAAMSNLALAKRGSNATVSAIRRQLDSAASSLSTKPLVTSTSDAFPASKHSRYYQALNDYRRSVVKLHDRIARIKAADRLGLQVKSGVEASLSDLVHGLDEMLKVQTASGLPKGKVAARRALSRLADGAREWERVRKLL